MLFMDPDVRIQNSKLNIPWALPLWYKRPKVENVGIVAEGKKREVDIIRVDSDSLRIRNRKVLDPSYAAFLIPRT
jgi:hypothetical protein